MPKKRLYRPKEGRILLGVCQGLALYFDIDPALVRLIMVILTIWGGVGVILYIIGIFVIPDEETQPNDKKKGVETSDKIKDKVQSVASEVKQNISRQSTWKGEQIFGLVILLIGLVFLFQNFFPWFNFGHYWPIILIVIGLIIMTARARKG